jgi:hypothetical protein
MAGRSFVGDRSLQSVLHYLQLADDIWTLLQIVCSHLLAPRRVDGHHILPIIQTTEGDIELTEGPEPVTCRVIGGFVMRTLFGSVANFDFRG